MKQVTINTISILAAVLISSAAIAQGRHDEKPHGMMKPSPTAAEQSRGSGTGGRHDEGATTHGKKKPAAKKAQASEEGGAAGK